MMVSLASTGHPEKETKRMPIARLSLGPFPPCVVPNSLGIASSSLKFSIRPHVHSRANYFNHAILCICAMWLHCKNRLIWIERVMERKVRAHLDGLEVLDLSKTT